MRQTPHQPHIVADPIKSDCTVLVQLREAQCDFVKCDFHLKQPCRKTWTDVLKALFPRSEYGGGYIDRGWLIILEALVEGSISESEIPNADSYRQLIIANPRFKNMLRREARCAGGEKKRNKTWTVEESRTASFWSNARTFGEWQKIKSLGKLRDDRTLVLRDLGKLLEDPVISEELGIYGGRTEIDDMLRIICPTRPAHPLDSAPDRQDEMYGQGRAMDVQEQLAQAWPTLSYRPQEDSDHLSSIDVGNFTGWSFGGTTDAPIASPTDQYQSGWQDLSSPQVAQGESLGNDKIGHASFGITSQAPSVPLATFNTQSQAGSQYPPGHPGPLGEPSVDKDLADRNYLDDTATRSHREETGVPALTPGQTSVSSSMNPHTPLMSNSEASTFSSGKPVYPEFDSYIRYDSVTNDNPNAGPNHARDVSSSPDAGRRPSVSSNTNDQESKRARQTSPERRDQSPLTTREDLQARECDMIQRILRQLAARFEGMVDHLSKRSRIIAPIKLFWSNPAVQLIEYSNIGVIIPLEGSHTSSDWDQLWNSFHQGFPTQEGPINSAQINRMIESVEEFGRSTNRTTNPESLNTTGYSSCSEYRDPESFPGPHTLARRLWGRSEASGSPWAYIVKMVAAISTPPKSTLEDGSNAKAAPNFHAKAFKAKVAEFRAALRERQLQAAKKHLAIISALERLRGIPNLLDPAGSRTAVDAVKSIWQGAQDLAELGYEEKIAQGYKSLAQRTSMIRVTPATDLVNACETFLMAIGPVISRPPHGYHIPTLERWRTSVRLDAAAQILEESRVVDSLARMIADPGSRTAEGPEHQARRYRQRDPTIEEVTLGLKVLSMPMRQEQAVHHYQRSNK